MGFLDPPASARRNGLRADRQGRHVARDLRDLESARSALKRTASMARRSGIARLVAMVPGLDDDLARIDAEIAELREQSATGDQGEDRE